MARPNGIQRARGLRGGGRSFKKNMNTILKLIGGVDPSHKRTPEKVQRRQTTQYVSSQINPVIGNIEKSIGRRSTAGQGAITGYTRELAGIYDRGKADVDAAYTKQRADEEAANTALSGFLRGRGAEASSELASKLQQAGLEGPAPAGGAPGMGTANAADNPKPAGEKEGAPPGPMPPGPPPSGERLSDRPLELGQGLGGESAGRGFSTLSRVGSEGAAMRALAAEMPSIAALGGLSTSRALQLQLNREQADKIGDVTAQVPGMIESLMEKQRDREISKGDRRTALRGSRAEMFQNLLNSTEDRDLQRAIANQGLNTDIAQLGENQYQFDQGQQLAYDQLEAETLKAITNAKPDVAKKRMDAYNKTLAEVDSMFEAPTNALGIADPNFQPNPSEIYEQTKARLRGRLPQAPKKVIDELAGSILAANGYPGYGKQNYGSPPKPKKPKKGKKHPKHRSGV